MSEAETAETEPGWAGGAVRAALLELCDEILGVLKGLEAEDAEWADGIHQARKMGKRLRGGLTMVGEPKVCVKWVAMMGGMLGGVRDRVVREKTWRTLKVPEPVAGSLEAAMAGMLRHEAEAAGERPALEVLEWCQMAMVQVRARLDAAEAGELALRAVEGEKKLRRRLRKRLRVALDRAENEDFHEARKAAKAWLGGLSLGEGWPTAPGRVAVERLASLLGDENDLEVLAAWLERHRLGPGTAPQVWKRLRRRQEKVRRRSIRLIRKEVLPVLEGF